MRRSSLLLTILPFLAATTAAQAQLDPSGVPSSGYTQRQVQPYSPSPYGNVYGGGAMGYLTPQVPGAVTILPGGAVQYQTPLVVPQYGAQRAPDNSTSGRINGMFDPTAAMQVNPGGPTGMNGGTAANGMPGMAGTGAAGAADGTAAGQAGGAAVPGGTATGTTPGGATAVLPAVPGASPAANGQTPAGGGSAAAAGMQPGETFSGRIQISSSGAIQVGDRTVMLDGASLPAMDEVCGSGQMIRCGRVAAAIAEGLFSRMSLARCSVVTAQVSLDAPIHAACQTGRQDVAAILVQAGAARAEGTQFMAHQADAVADSRGLWAGSTVPMQPRRAAR